MHEQDEVSAIAALSSSDFQDCIHAIAVCRQFATPAVVEALKHFLTRKHPFSEWENHILAIETVRILESLDVLAVEALIELLRDGDEQVQALAASALVKTGGIAIPSLIAALTDPVTGLRRRAIWVLAMIGDARAVDPLIDMLRQPDVKTRRYAADALGRIGARQAIQPLINALNDDDKRVRWDAARALDRFQDEAIEPLVQVLYRGTNHAREAAANALAWMGDARAVASLVGALQDRDSQVRSRAAFALGWIRDAQAVPALIDTLYDSDMEVRLQAVVSLGWIRDHRAVQPLIDMLLNENEWMIYAAVEALGDIGDARAIKPLSITMNKASIQFQQAARDALRKLNTPASTL